MKITATSQLMPNHVAGAPLPAQESVAAAYTGTQSPLLFSLDEAHKFAITMPSADSGTGWEQIDLGAQLAGAGGLGAEAKVQAFAVSQDTAGTIWLVVAAAATATGPSSVFISAGLSNQSTAADWNHLRQHLSARKIPDGLTVSQAVVGSTGGSYPLAVVVAADSDGKMHHLQLNPQPGPGDWQSMPLQFATNTTRCRTVAVGFNDRYGPGVYAVCELATLVNLTFTTLPRMVGGRPVVQTVEMKLPDGLNPFAIAPVATAGGRTELYAAGQGVYRWPVSAQVRSNLPGTPVADAASFAGVTELVAAEDTATGHISVWGQDQRDVLMQVTGLRASPDAVTWQAPLPVAPEVTAVAGYRVAAQTGTSTAGLLLGTSSGALTLTVQDPLTTLWQQQTVALRRPELAQTLNTYTTRVVATDDEGQPLRNFTVNVQPADDCAVLINGAYYALKKTVAKPADTDVTGVLTIVSETSDITAPVYTFTAGTVTTREDPGAEAKKTLRAVQNESQLVQATKCNGDPLFPTPPDPDTAKAAATAISKVMDAHDALAAGRRPAALAGPARAAAQHPRPMFAVHYHHGRSALLNEAEAALAGPAAPEDWFQVSPGDLLRALFGESQFTYWVDEAWNFCVQIGNQFLQFLVDVAEKAIGVVDWVLRKTLGLSLDDLVAWLGFIFSWGDIRRNHTAIAKLVDMTLGWTVTSAADTKAQISTGFEAIRKQINGGGIHPDLSNPVVNGKTKTAPDQPESSKSPEGNWGSQQLSANAGDAKPAGSSLPIVEDLWTKVGDDEIKVMQQAYASLQDQLVDHYEDYTFAELIEKFLEIVAKTVVDATEKALLTMVDAGALMVSVTRALLNTRWDIPVLTYVYEQIICAGDGSKLTLLDLLSLLAAIPATIGAKLVTGQNLFTDAQLKVIADATTWDQLIHGLVASPAPRPGPGQQLAASDPALMVAASLEFIGMFTRLISGVFFALRELTDFSSEAKIIFNGGKIAADYVTYGMSVISMFIIMVKNPGSSGRRAIDQILTVTSGLSVVRDVYVLYLLEKYGKDRADIGANIFRVVETIGGFFVVIAACVSLGLQAAEPAPPGIDIDAWRSMVAMKFIQNLCSGAYWALAFAGITSNSPDFRYKAAVVRTVILAVRWAANCVRVSLQLAYRIADYDGPL